MFPILSYLHFLPLFPNSQNTLFYFNCNSKKKEVTKKLITFIVNHFDQCLNFCSHLLKCEHLPSRNNVPFSTDLYVKLLLSVVDTSHLTVSKAVTVGKTLSFSMAFRCPNTNISCLKALVKCFSDNNGLVIYKA